MKNILGITAHPDDHIMFAGTILKLQEQGYEYYELLLTDGNEGIDYRVSKNKKPIITEREKEFAAASRFLKTKRVFKLHQDDQNLLYSKELMHKIIEVIREVKPAVGITMNRQDVHPDHCAAAHLSREAFRWAAKGFRPELGEKHRTNIVLFAEGTEPISPNFLVDITKYYAAKEELFNLYASQASPKDIELMKSFAHIRGYHLRKSTSEYAEAFSVENNILPILFESN